MSKLLAHVFFLMISISGITQERIDTDRPDKTESAELTPTHYLQAEFGLGAEMFGKGNYNIAHPDLLLKYGLTKKFELRLGNAFITDHSETPSQTKKISGLETVRIGFRTSLCEEKKIVPKTSLLVHAGIPFLASKNYKAQHLAPSFLLAMKNSLKKSVELSYNLGAEWNGFTSIPAWLYSLSSGYDVGKHWEVFIEVFGSVMKNEMAENSIDAGFGYYVSRDIKLDASAGIGIAKAASDFFGVGFSLRFH